MEQLTYTTLEDLPIYNWFKVSETNDYKWLLKSYDKDHKEDLRPLFDQMNQEFLDIFGPSSEREKLMSLYKRLIKHKADYILGKKHVINYIKVIEFQLMQLGQDNTKKQSVFEICAIISKEQGYNVDPKQTNVITFYSILKNIEKNGN